LDGANIEMATRLDLRISSLFGLTAEEVERLKAEDYTPRRIYESTGAARGDRPHSVPVLSKVIAGFLPARRSAADPRRLYAPADYQAYVDCQQRVSHAYSDQNA
jgi:starch phosphorylase